jgi:dTDP-4-amino-4,6-dideoxygalactose transaminase
MQIPFHKPYITSDEISEVVDSLRSGWITMGPKTVKFEEEFGAYIGAEHSIAVNSCTAALHLALKVIGLQPEDEVIIPTMTFTATGEVVCYFSAKPVIVDVDRNTHNIDPSAIERAITAKTRAIVPVHFGGQPCDMEEILDIARRYRLNVIEDAAHALPAAYGGRMIGTIGDITCFSFYATKTLATGEGGMITTDNGEWAERLRMLRLHGISKDAWKRYSDEGSWYYEVAEAGYKYNMTDIQAGLGLAQLRKVEWMRQKREEIALKYDEAFRQFCEIDIPYIKPDRTSAWHLYVIILNLKTIRIDRARFIEELKTRGVSTSVHFIPLHRHPFYSEAFGYDTRDFPSAEWLYERVVSLPIYPGLTDEETGYVCETVCDVLRRNRR